MPWVETGLSANSLASLLCTPTIATLRSHQHHELNSKNGRSRHHSFNLKFVGRRHQAAEASVVKGPIVTRRMVTMSITPNCMVGSLTAVALAMGQEVMGLARRGLSQRQIPALAHLGVRRDGQGAVALRVLLVMGQHQGGAVERPVQPLPVLVVMITAPNLFELQGLARRPARQVEALQPGMLALLASCIG